MNARIPMHLACLMASLAVAGLALPAVANADDEPLRHVRHDPDSIPSRLSSELSLLQAAFVSNRQHDILDRLLYPLDPRTLPIRGTALEQQAMRSGGRIDRNLAAIFFDDLFGDEEQRLRIGEAMSMVSSLRSSSPYSEDGNDVVVDAPRRGVSMRYRLSLAPPRESVATIDGMQHAVQAEVTLVWGSQSMFDGSVPGADDGALAGSMQMRLIDGQLYIVGMSGAG